MLFVTVPLPVCDWVEVIEVVWVIVREIDCDIVCVCVGVAVLLLD